MTSEMPGGQRGSKGGGYLYGQREQQQQQQDDDDLHAFTQIQGTIHVGKGGGNASQPAKWLFDSHAMRDTGQATIRAGGY